MKKILIYIITILLMATVVSAADHYIDPEAAQGGDGTIGDPWNNWSDDVGDSSYTCGDTYYFKKGTIHRDNVALYNKDCSSGNEVTLDAYGSGANPIITSRHRVDGSSGWTDNSGIWWYDPTETSIEGFWVGIDGTDDWGNEIRENNTNTSSPSDGNWCYYNSRIYYNPSASDPEPDDANFFMEYTDTDATAHPLSGIYIESSDYVILNNLQSLHSRFHGLVVLNSDHGEINDCNFDYNGTSSDYLNQGQRISIGNGIEFQSSDYWNVNGGSTNYNFDNGGGCDDNGIVPSNNITFTGVELSHNGSSGGYVKSRNDSASAFAQIDFIECEAADNGNADIDCNHYSYSGIKYYDNAYGSVKFCYLHDNLGAGLNLWNEYPPKLTDAVTMLIQGNVIVGNATGNTVGWPGTDRLKIEDGGLVISDSFLKSSNQTIRIYNNTISDNTLYGLYQYDGDLYANLYVYNNIITGNTSKDVRIEDDSSIDTTIHIDTNLYSASLSNYLGATNYTSIATWNAVSGIGTDLSGNPYLNANYYPESNSPAIDAGTDLTATYDDIVISGSSWPDSVTTGVQGDYGTGWDIGFGVTSGISAPVISGQGPTSTQTCDGTTSTDEIYLDTDRDATCRASRKGTDTCATAYASLDVEMTDEGGNHHTFTGSGAGEPGYQVTCGDTETIVAICQDDSTSEYSNCVEWSYQVDPPPVGAISQRHPVAWANIAQIHPVAVADIAQIHPVDTAAEAGEVECDDCSGTLMFSWHMENNDSTPDVTVHDSIDDPCGCSDGDEVGAGTENPIFSGAEQSDGSYSLLISSTDDRYDFTVSSKDLIDPDDVKITFDLYVSSYPSSGYAEVIRTSYNADNNTVIWVTDSNTVKAVHIGGGTADDVEVAVATGSFVSCEYQAKQGVAGNDHYLICGATSDEDDDDLVATAASTNYLQFGDHYGTGAATFYIDNVKIYPCDKY